MPIRQRPHLQDQTGAGRRDDRVRARRGGPFAWFTADEEFGQDPGLCDYLETSRIAYVMAVPKTTHFTDTAENMIRSDELSTETEPTKRRTVSQSDPALWLLVGGSGGI